MGLFSRRPKTLADPISEAKQRLPLRLVQAATEPGAFPPEALEAFLPAYAVMTNQLQSTKRGSYSYLWDKRFYHLTPAQAEDARRNAQSLAIGYSRTVGVLWRPEHAQAARQTASDLDWFGDRLYETLLRIEADLFHSVGESDPAADRVLQATVNDRRFAGVLAFWDFLLEHDELPDPTFERWRSAADARTSHLARLGTQPAGWAT